MLQENSPKDIRKGLVTKLILCIIIHTYTKGYFKEQGQNYEKFSKLATRRTINLQVGQEQRSQQERQRL